MPDEETSVVTNEKTKIRLGVQVPQKGALDALQQKCPPAAEWFYRKGFPKEDQCFFFGATEFRALTELRHQKILVYDNMETGRWEVPGDR